MSQTYKNFEKGIGLVPNNSDQNQVKGDLNVLSSDGKIAYHNGTSSSPVVTESHASQGVNRLKNKDLEDATTAIVDSTDPTKKIIFDVQSSHASSTTTLTLPNSSDTLVARDTQDTLTNKTLTLPIMSQITSGSYTLTLPSSGSDTLVGKATSDVFTNKTYDTAATGNVFKINGTQLTGKTGTGDIVLDSSPVISSPQINYPVLFEPTTNKISSYNLQDLQYYTQTSSNWHRFYCGVTEISRILNTGLEIQPSKNITFTTATNSISISAPTINSNYSITLPQNAPFQNTSLFYNKAGSYVWESVLNNNKSLQLVTPVYGTGSPATPSVYGCAIPTVTGTSTNITPTFTSYYTSRKIIEYTAISGGSAVAGWRWATEPAIVGTSSYGGFKFCNAFGFVQGFSSGGTNRTFFVGLTSTTFSPGFGNPSTSYPSLLGVGLDALDSNLQFMHGTSSSITKIDLGVNFARPTSDKANFYRIEINAYNGTVSYRIENMINGAIVSGSVTSNIPPSTTLLSPRGYMGCGSTSSAVGIAMEYVTFES